jgi:uncharacterized protein YndB with AHSA1/START domain
MSSPTATNPARTYDVFIKATPERIWEAITRPEFTSRYFLGTLVETDLVPGGVFRYYSPNRAIMTNDGNIIEVDPPRRLVTTRTALWSPELAAEPPTRVTWEIEPQAEGYCHLTVIHDELEAAPKSAAAHNAWMLVLSGLKTLLETGEPLASR